jgi:hypothetical protein
VEPVRRLIGLVAIAALLVWAGAGTASARPEGAREVALQFGNALTSSAPDRLEPLLPASGRVRLKLFRMGTEDGFFGPLQVQAIFRDFLGVGSVRSFELIHLETDGRSYSLAHAQALVVDRQGRTASSDLRIAFQPEDGRWVIREIKESAE